MADDELKRLIEAQIAEMRRGFEGVDNRFDHVREQFAEMRRYFDIVLERQEVRFAAVNEAVTSLDERMQRGFSTIEERITSESSETRTMMRLLQKRVERLEETTH